MIKNPIDCIVAFFCGFLFVSFAIFLFLTMTVPWLAIHGIFLTFLLWSALLIWNNRRLQKWHRYFCKERGHHVERRRVWVTDSYSAYEYRSINEWRQL